LFTGAPGCLTCSSQGFYFFGTGGGPLTTALAEVVDGDDVGVVEAGEGVGFGGEAGGEPPLILRGGGVLGELWGEDFEGDDAVEGFLAGFVDGAHAAAAEEGEEVEVGEEGGEGF